jgi:hypothetical protein
MAYRSTKVKFIVHQYQKRDQHPKERLIGYHDLYVVDVCLVASDHVECARVEGEVKHDGGLGE